MKLSINAPMTLGERDPVAAIERASEFGVDVVEFWDPETFDVDAVSGASADHGVDVAAVGTIGAGGNIAEFDEPAMTDPSDHDRAVSDIARSIEIADRLDAPNLIITVGPDQPELGGDEQFKAVRSVLEDVADRAEAAGVTLVVEPLNVAVNHEGYFLVTSEEGFELIDQVGSPNIKLLYDVYHQQITEGNVIETIREHVEQIGHFHFADVPGRHEPGTGELAYENIFAAIEETGYDGYVGGEYLPSTDVEEIFDALDAMRPDA